MANFFCEFAGFECDYSLLPDKTTREVFYEIYLSAGDTVEQLEKEVEVFYIATHLFWGIWSVLQSKFSPIEFDFLDYARMRLRQGRVARGKRRFNVAFETGLSFGNAKVTERAFLVGYCKRSALHEVNLDIRWIRVILGNLRQVSYKIYECVRTAFFRFIF